MGDRQGSPKRPRPVSAFPTLAQRTAPVSAVSLAGASASVAKRSFNVFGDV